MVPLVMLLLTGCIYSAGKQYAEPLKWNDLRSAAQLKIYDSTVRAVKATGPLQVCRYNPRFFADGSGKAVLLSGLEFWDVLLADGQETPEAISWSDFLNICRLHGVNFIRLWRWNELIKFRSKPTKPWYTSKDIWIRSGPKSGLDGKPEFDLTKFNQAYFDELRARVIEAGERGFYVSIMLFEGWSLRYMEAPWRWDGHPLNVNNNVQGINGDPNGDGEGIEIHTLEIPEATYYQEQYVKKVIDTVNDLDNVLYEISNEDHIGSTAWQYHMINYIKNYERGHKAKQHPVWMSVQLVAGDPDRRDLNENLFNSSADCIAPGAGYLDNPPPGNGKKIVISDTDHLCAGPQDHAWVWKSFTRGLNVVNYMELRQLVDSDPVLVSARNAMGHVLEYSRRINLAAMTPQGNLSSSGYALVEPGKEYLIYLPSSEHWLTRFLGWHERVKLDLSGFSETFHLEWFNPRTGVKLYGGEVKGGGEITLTAPTAGDAVLYIYKP